MLHGIAADQSIDKSELEGLQAWLIDRDFLKGTYPYDEVESLVIGVLADGRIDPQEHEQLIEFFEQFIGYSLKHRVARALAEVQAGAPAVRLSRGGICAVDPEIVFPERAVLCSPGCRSEQSGARSVN